MSSGEGFGLLQPNHIQYSMDKFRPLRQARDSPITGSAIALSGVEGAKADLLRRVPQKM
jgi:hypothetical protein